MEAGKYKIGQHTAKKLEVPAEYSEWKANPSDDNYLNLIKKVDPIIQSGLTSFGGGDKTLQTRAKILATQALETYDPSKGASLNTHVYNNLKRLQRFRANRDRALHVPESVRSDSIKVRKYVDEYMNSKGYEPSDLEVSDKLGISAKRVKKARAKGELSTAAFSSDKGDLPAERTNNQVWFDYVYHDANDIDRKILEWTTGYNGAKILPKRDIAKKLKITPAAISLRVSKLAKKLGEGV